MPQITINGRACEFKPGQMILQVANQAGIEIPQYCYHDGLSIVASCRICLAEVWQPNPRNNNALEPIPKLIPTCQTACADGMVVYTDSPKSIANQKAVMEYLLINHPLDCPVCDQSGECFLQDYSYEYGRGVSRFEEAKVKQPKKDLGPHVYLYADRCIMCTRCVRFTREVTGTAELLVGGRGNKEEIDVFPGRPIDNELSANVIDLCPVGALLDKDFLFTQRVWFLKETSSIDGVTASGDNIRIDHNDGKIYRVKPRTNMAVNKWWISDEVRYGWKHVHSDDRLTSPLRKQFGVQVESDWNRAYDDAITGINRGLGRVQSTVPAAKVNGAKGNAGSHNSLRAQLAVLISPMLSCEDAYCLANLAMTLDKHALVCIGPVPMLGQDKVFPPNDPNGYRVYAEKAPNARGVRRVVDAVLKKHGHHEPAGTYQHFVDHAGQCGTLLVTGNYPSDWVTDEMVRACDKGFVVAIDTLRNRLTERADVVLPSCTWTEKAGCFENARGMIQAFEQAIPPVGISKSEGQIALDLMAVARGERKLVESSELVINPAKAGQVPGSTTVATPLGEMFNAGNVRGEMARSVPGLDVFAREVSTPKIEVVQRPDMDMVEL